MIQNLLKNMKNINTKPSEFLKGKSFPQLSRVQKEYRSSIIASLTSRETESRQSKNQCRVQTEQGTIAESRNAIQCTF